MADSAQPQIELPGLRFALGEDIDMLRATVRSFAQADLAPRASDIDRSNHFPMDAWKKLGALGLLGTVPLDARDEPPFRGRSAAAVVGSRNAGAERPIEAMG